MRDWNARLSSTLQARDQVELLEHQAEPVAPQRRPAGIAESREIAVPSSLISPPSAAIEPGDQMQQRALAAAGFAGQRHALAGGDIEVDAAQHRDLLAGRAIALGQIADAQHGVLPVAMRCCLAGKAMGSIWPGRSTEPAKTMTGSLSSRRKPGPMTPEVSG